MRRIDDDSSGKGKDAKSKTRFRVLGTLYLVGICLGVIVAERIYVLKRAVIPRPRQLVSSIEQRIESAMHNIGHHHAAQGPPRNDLEAYLRRIAPQREVLACVANENIVKNGMVETYTQGYKRNNITNSMILALDQYTVDWCHANGVNAYLMNMSIAEVHKGTGDNHAVSALKFGILTKFIELGWSVLLSDVDICIFQNPFEHLYRDSDIEGQTDGFDEHTAYGSIEGFDDPSMGWGRYAQYYKHFNMNSGLFYVMANNRTLEMMTRLADRLARERHWDQTAYNEEMFFLSHGSYKSPQVSVRVMEIDKFMNSKRLFKDIRHRPKGQQPPLPVMVHINYHPDKHDRMKAVVKYFLEGDEHALDRFPGGSEPNTRR
ncbi:hypothetical protein HYH03_004593 [Edaphochlamys debaryana]|uniref:Nucleotide-diphospho-sugar transferase domain-containing protein n=1 Tax=Edaphochlamys debaryana TaxID=47281 RepID=A0A835Y9W8_9CHLO|nr:hypothetical protein HYH03_004593 [Edaphochlamys debaryana]|eukprot:KAG2497438.1 hypothetical protein HYH03_004593 [Edaphochlamys debaryana]